MGAPISRGYIKGSACGGQNSEAPHSGKPPHGLWTNETLAYYLLWKGCQVIGSFSAPEMPLILAAVLYYTRDPGQTAKSTTYTVPYLNAGQLQLHFMRLSASLEEGGACEQQIPKIVHIFEAISCYQKSNSQKTQPLIWVCYDPSPL